MDNNKSFGKMYEVMTEKYISDIQETAKTDRKEAYDMLMTIADFYEKFGLDFLFPEFLDEEVLGDLYEEFSDEDED